VQACKVWVPLQYLQWHWTLRCQRLMSSSGLTAVVPGVFHMVQSGHAAVIVRLMSCRAHLGSNCSD
jgi:hypothetical protein